MLNNSGLQPDTIYHDTALNLLRHIPREAIDLIVTDPPYGIGYKSSHRRDNANRPQKAVLSSFGVDELQIDWVPHAAQCLKQNGAMYIFSRWDKFQAVKTALEKSGLHVPMRLVWDKLHWTGGNLNYYGLQDEVILFAVKGKHELRWSKREGNIIRLTKLDTINREGNYDNPTQKPEALMEYFIRRSSDKGELIVDPFCGTGTTAAAARKLGRRYLCSERDQYQFDIASQRLRLPYTHEML